MITNACTDQNCPHHHCLRTRGREFTGTIIESKAQKTAVVEIERRHYLPKYERYEPRRTRLKTHNPECINAKKGDIVTIQECRPLSKTKHFTILKKLGQNISFMEREELLEQAKITPAKEPETEEKTQ